MAEARVPIIAFVWRPEETGPPVTQMAHRTGSRAIFDFSVMGAEALRSFLQRTSSAGHIGDIKISARTLMDTSLGRSLKDAGVQDIWVECQPPFSQGELSAFLQRLRVLSENHRCFPIIGDLDLLAAILKDGSGIGRIVLKGCEASGFVSGETALVLYSAAKEMLRAGSKSMDILIWGGAWTPEAAAAFLSTGATGIVFESVHWLTDLVAIDDLQRQQLAKLRMDSTALVGLDLKVPCRLFNKGNSLAFKEIKTLEDSLCAAEITDESRRSFVSQVQARALHPLKSHFTQDEVIPLGVEAAFAASFVERFGTGTETAVKALAQIRGPAAITRLLEIAIAATSVGDIDLFADNGLAALGPDDVAALGSALGHANMAVRVKAIECLAAIGGDVAINLIIKQVASSNATVQAAAISALGDAGSTLATAALIKALDNSKNFDAATTSLAQIYDTDATPLLKYLKAKSTIKVYAPIIEIGQAGTESALITGLNSYGYKDMAVDYLNCGNPQLDKAAHTWATKHGYTVYTTPGGGGAVSWGG